MFQFLFNCQIYEISGIYSPLQQCNIYSFTFVRSSCLRLATLRAFLSVLLMKAGELSPAMAFCRSKVLAKISSGLRPLAASSRCIAANICQQKILCRKWSHSFIAVCAWAAWKSQFLQGWQSALAVNVYWCCCCLKLLAASYQETRSHPCLRYIQTKCRISKSGQVLKFSNSSSREKEWQHSFEMPN